MSGVWRTVGNALLCVALAGAGLSVIAGVVSYQESRLPFVDLSSRSASAEPSAASAADGDELRFAVATMVSAEATFSTYRHLVQEVSRSVGRQTRFVLRPSYAEVRRGLEQGEVDVAFVCTGTYVHAMPRKTIKLLVQPQFLEGLEYRSLLIVPAKSSAEKLEDLRGAAMAFTDPESNTGCLVPSAKLAEMGLDPGSFFCKVAFTGSHDRSIQAVALGLTDAAAVDSLVWESVKAQDPSVADRVRVIWQSEPFGPPPIVVPANIDPALEKLLRQAFLALDEDAEGRRILSAMGIERFVPGREEDYRTAHRLYEGLQEGQGDGQWP